jgi:hypothetical protein
MEKTANCPKHGKQGIGLACTHVAHAIDSGAQVGFFWGDDEDAARPDAWCRKCEQALVAMNGQSSEQWFIDAQFKILCAACWDEAKRNLYELPRMRKPSDTATE